MPTTFQEILNSRIFKFIVGEKADGNPVEFHVHEGAIAQLSQPLHALMKGGMSEDLAGCAKWPDVSKETFERFVQFAYTGDYSMPKPGNRVEPRMNETAASDLEVEVEGTSGNNSFMSKKDRKKAQREQLRQVDLTPLFLRNQQPKESPLPDFHSLSYPLLAPRNSYADTCEPPERLEQGRSYSNVLLSHASLYVLGDGRLIDSLKALALFKLHKTLRAFPLDRENAMDIVDLARYAYAEEGKGYDEGIGALRGLICHYMATNLLVLSLDAGFMDLLSDGGQFVKDLFGFTVQRICS